VAGPIVRYGAIEQQMRQRSHTADKFACGVMFFCKGMAKKIVIANPLAQVSDAAFAGGSLDLFDAWYGIVAYAFQIYFDFSGYSDMASGLALMMGFVLMQNFSSEGTRASGKRFPTQPCRPGPGQKTARQVHGAHAARGPNATGGVFP
jgi:alginate O-acetyltransferase complex protein AlgI